MSEHPEQNDEEAARDAAAVAPLPSLAESHAKRSRRSPRLPNLPVVETTDKEPKRRSNRKSAKKDKKDQKREHWWRLGSGKPNEPASGPIEVPPVPPVTRPSRRQLPPLEVWDGESEEPAAGEGSPEQASATESGSGEAPAAGSVGSRPTPPSGTPLPPPQTPPSGTPLPSPPSSTPPGGFPALPPVPEPASPPKGLKPPPGFGSGAAASRPSPPPTPPTETRLPSPPSTPPSGTPLPPSTPPGGFPVPPMPPSAGFPTVSAPLPEGPTESLHVISPPADPAQYRREPIVFAGPPAVARKTDADPVAPKQRTPDATSTGTELTVRIPPPPGDAPAAAKPPKDSAADDGETDGDDKAAGAASELKTVDLSDSPPPADDAKTTDLSALGGAPSDHKTVDLSASPPPPSDDIRTTDLSALGSAAEDEDTRPVTPSPAFPVTPSPPMRGSGFLERPRWIPPMPRGGLSRRAKIVVTVVASVLACAASVYLTTLVAGSHDPSGANDPKGTSTADTTFDKDNLPPSDGNLSIAPDQSYRVRSWGTRKCLGQKPSDDGKTLNAVLDSCDGKYWMNYIEKAKDGGGYRIQPTKIKEDSKYGSCVVPDGTGPGKPFRTAFCDAKRQEYFHIDGVVDKVKDIDVFRIRAAKGDFCMTVRGTAMVQQPCEKSDPMQQFVFEPVDD
ncbi:MAG TPA: hypothetical protein VE172_04605 [Stackebrandtia sp.]|uniref:RICIN domain-containing protein n=1 Tax=Stackebrandtia sp. TaxID=2023065 RepID=UPI002D36262B|nr:hypothetical protein [Stackebrandtia sp.]HZE38074.1 hypothetical protein [Stackebrandtia sp.]